MYFWLKIFFLSKYFSIYKKIDILCRLNLICTNSCQISVLPEVTHAHPDTHRSEKLLVVSGCIPLCQPLCHRVKSVGWLVLVIRPVSHYTHTQGKRFASAQRINLSILLTVDVRCAFSVFTIAADSPQALFYSAKRRISSTNCWDLYDIFTKWL